MSVYETVPVFEDYVTEEWHVSDRDPGTRKSANASSQCCPNCEVGTYHVSGASDYKEIDVLTDSSWTSAGEICPKCGWWRSYKVDYLNDNGTSQQGNKVYTSVARKFDLRGSEVPISELRHYLAQNPEYLHEIDPYKTEKLIGAIFQDHYDCEIKYTGRSRDGGIDLFAIFGGVSYAVQVKNRRYLSNRYNAEPVDAIHILHSAARVSQSTGAIFVTTAKKFSQSASLLRNQLLAAGELTEFELFDLDKTLNLLGMTVEKNFERLKKRFVLPR